MSEYLDVRMSGDILEEALIECSECDEEVWVKGGTWALAEGMCEQCYCIYQGG